MSNFPSDVVKAEELTKGNVNILETLETPKKASASFSTPDKSSVAELSPAVSKKSTGAYNSASKVQLTPIPAPKSDKMFTCTMCSFSTERMNLLMFHLKNHSSSMPPRVSGKIHSTSVFAQLFFISNCRTVASCREKDSSEESSKARRQRGHHSR